MQNKYKDITFGKAEAVFNKLGGVEGVEAFLRDNVKVTFVKHAIDLTKPPRLPLEDAEVIKHEGKGVVEIELRSDGLYIDGQEVVLHLSERQLDDKPIASNELRKELEGGEQVLLNSNVLDYLYDHPELFPEHWKKDKNGETRYIFFWGSIFRGQASGDLCVCYLFWNDGDLNRDYVWFDHDWNHQNPSASVAS